MATSSATPFADDFDLITYNVKKHQKLMLNVQQKAESMGLTFKPSKFRSLSIQAGKVTDTKFFLMDGRGEEKVYWKTMEDDPHKFLADNFTFLKDKLKVKLANLDKSTVRGEYKVTVYTLSPVSLLSPQYPQDTCLITWPGSFSSPGSPSLPVESQTLASSILDFLD